MRGEPASGLKLFLKWPQLFPFPASPSWFYVHSVLPEPYFQSAFFFFFFMRMMCLDFTEIERFHDTKDKSYELSSIYHLTAIEKDATLFL